jgi:hypothetical protein
MENYVSFLDRTPHVIPKEMIWDFSENNHFTGQTFSVPSGCTIYPCAVINVQQDVCPHPEYCCMCVLLGNMVAYDIRGNFVARNTRSENNSA